MNDIKTTIIDRIVEKIEAQIKTAERGRSDAVEESRAHKGTMASRYDTFKEEAQYLAGGYEVRLLELRKMLGTLKFIKDHLPTITKCTSYAIVEAKDLDNGLIVKYFLLPTGGGDIYEVNGEKITVINVDAPMAHAFIGAIVNDETEVKNQDTTRRFVVVSIT